MAIADLLLQLLHQVLIVLAIVIIATVGEGRVNQSGKHVDQCREQIAATQTILIYVDLPPDSQTTT